jgi:lipoprotein-releasing system ATP-binding protein
VSAAVIELRSVERHYVQGSRKLTILNGADFALVPGEMVAMVAPSGAGKSTLLHTAGLLERPDAGDVILAGRACGRLSDDERTAIRRNDIGFVYQFHHLLPEFSALENIMMPQIIKGLSRTEAASRAEQLLDYMQIGKRAQHRPSELSGGEQQRVAIARALVNQPAILLADEPTGNLDTENSQAVLEILRQLNRTIGQTILMITHNPEAAEFADRTVAMRDGRLRTK